MAQVLFRMEGTHISGMCVFLLSDLGLGLRIDHDGMFRDLF
jgi:hypothetical protein